MCVDVKAVELTEHVICLTSITVLSCGIIQDAALLYNFTLAAFRSQHTCGAYARNNHEVSTCFRVQQLCVARSYVHVRAITIVVS
jgi:hypothetical protein